MCLFIGCAIFWVRDIFHSGGVGLGVKRVQICWVAGTAARQEWDSGGGSIYQISGKVGGEGWKKGEGVASQVSVSRQS